LNNVLYRYVKSQRHKKYHTVLSVLLSIIYVDMCITVTLKWLYHLGRTSGLKTVKHSVCWWEWLSR